MNCRLLYFKSGLAGLGLLIFLLSQLGPAGLADLAGLDSAWAETLAANSKANKSTDEEQTSNKVIVGHQNSYEQYSIQLDSGQTANVIVYLASAGEMVNGFRVSLVHTKSHKLIKTLVSNEQGIVKFSGLRPGYYTVVLRMSKRLRSVSSVNIGDVILGVDFSSLY